MKVQLVSIDRATVLREVEVRDFPDNPAIIIWQHRAFTSEFSYGDGPVQYFEQSTLEVE